MYRAAELPTPKERLTQIVRWYMSAFHASRNSSIAKKPYNPILGETFKCYWNVPGYEKTEVNRVEVVISGFMVTNVGILYFNSAKQVFVLLFFEGGGYIGIALSVSQSVHMPCKYMYSLIDGLILMKLYTVAVLSENVHEGGYCQLDIFQGR